MVTNYTLKQGSSSAAGVFRRQEVKVFSELDLKWLATINQICGLEAAV